MNKIKNCPFCGSEANVKRIRITYHKNSDVAQLNGQTEFFGVNCIRCGGECTGLLGSKTESEAIERWNCRV